MDFTNSIPLEAPSQDASQKFPKLVSTKTAPTTKNPFPPVTSPVPSNLLQKMCKLISIIGSTCRHPLEIEWLHCPSAPLPHRCPTMISSIDGYRLDMQTPYCPRCAKAMRLEVIAGFRKERGEKMRAARVGDWTGEDVGRMRAGLRDRLYERLKYVHKPLPVLPDGE